MQKSIIKVIISLLLFFIIIPSYAIDYNFYHLNTIHGLSQNTINFIHQDEKGFFWIGTNGGLNKWDGYDFTKYHYNPEDSTSIGQGRINCIYEDTTGELWIGTYGDGISKYNRIDNNFERFGNTENMLFSDHINNVQQIIRYNHHIVFSTFGKGLFILNDKENTLIPIQLFNEHNELIDNMLCHRLYIDKDSTLWVGHDKGVVKVNKQVLNISEPKLVGEELLKGKNILAIHRDSRDRIWFGTHYSGAFYLDLKSNQIYNLANNINTKSFIYSNVRNFGEDSKNNLWIATGGQGLIILDKENNVIAHYKSELNNEYSLSSNILYCIYQDKNGNMWIGTYNGGINYTNNHKQKFNHTRGFGGKNELINNSILSMCQISDHEIMLGTDGDGICIFNTLDKSIKQLNLLDNNKKNKNVPVIIKKDHQGNILIGSFLKGLYVYNRKKGTLKNYRKGNGKNDLQSNDIWAIAVGKDNKIWIGTLGKGIARFDLENEKFYNYSKKSNAKHGITEDYISSLIIDEQNTLWIGTYNGGLSMLVDEEMGIFKNFKRGDESGLTSNEISYLYLDSKNRIWANTHDGGVCLLNKETYTFTTFNTTHGLSSNSTKSIVEDKNGDFWVSSNQGISKIHFENDLPIIKNYTVQDGLQSNEFNWNTSLRSTADELYFGGNNGFNYFNPDSLITKNTVGQLVITDIKTLYHQDSDGTEKSIINEFNRNKAIVLSHNVSMLTFEYALLDYIVPERNTYKYKLDGYDKMWHDAGFNHKTTYTNLDPGNYQLRIIGTNGLGIKNNNELIIPITINPPYWKTMWFKTLTILITLLVIMIVYWTREKVHKQQEKLLHNTVVNRTKELLKLNTILAERNSEIKLQSEELLTKSEHLTEVNTKLELSYNKIENQNIELEEHRNNLELLVKKRTQQLEKSKIKAEESERLIMAFLANMSHEIRTPMNAIMGFSALISEDGFTKEEKGNYSKLIESNSQSLLLLIDDILDLSKIEANQLKITNINFDFMHLINESVANWVVISKEKFPNVDFEFYNNTMHKNLFIEGDSIRIKQIINNLIDNAFKFTCQGTVSLIISTFNKNIIVEVSDTGIGIPHNEIDNIFDRFRKIENSSEKQYRGAGLGLSISHKLAKLMNGRMEVNSEIGKGTSFKFFLPI